MLISVRGRRRERAERVLAPLRAWWARIACGVEGAAWVRDGVWVWVREVVLVVRVVVSVKGRLREDIVGSFVEAG